MENIALDLFHDMGNVFLIKKDILSMKRRLEKNPQTSLMPEIYNNNNPGEHLIDYLDPVNLWNNMYSSAGVSVGYITNIGSIGVSISQPIHQPDQQNFCSLEQKNCFDRRNDVSKIFWKTKV